MTGKRKFKKQFDQVWGIDRYRYSEDFGKQVLRAINLWDKPGGFANRAIGELVHGTRVTVLEEKQLGDRRWYLIADCENPDRQGWVVERLLKRRGKHMSEEGL